MTGLTRCTLALVAALSVWSGRAAAQDAAAGASVFKSQCAVCHTIVPGRKGVGPILFGVVGRAAGTVPDFRYTAANKQSGLIWDAATLDRYLLSPRTVMPGTSMVYPGLKDETKRANLVAYLATLK